MPGALLQGLPYTLTGDADGRWPLVMASPHSGRDYPAAFLAASRLPLRDLRRAEDAFVDDLLGGIAGVPVLSARYGRTFLDLNRAEDELDPAMFEAPLGLVPRLTDRVAAGLGVLPRIAASGLDIYARRLPPGEARARIAALHRPWHGRIASLLALARTRHGHAVLIDCHSMPTPAGPRPPQIVLGDRHGTSAAPRLVDLIEGHFAAAGLRVARNHPYAGGHTTEHHAAPGHGIHCVQIEIDRALYMDGHKLTRHGGFDGIARLMTSLARLIVDRAPRLGLGHALPLAAE